MKNFILFVLGLCAASVSAQEWKPLKVDQYVTVSLPGGPTRKDTAGQKEITAKPLFGYISINVVPDSVKTMPDIEKKKHLQKYYDNYTKQLSASVHGKVTEEVDTMVGQLNVKDFLLESNGAEGHFFRKFRLMHENCETYVFQYLYDAKQREVAAPEQAKFFNSIKVANSPSPASQFTAKEATPKKKHNSVIWIALVVVLLAAAAAARRRRKKGERAD